MIWKKWS